MTKCSVLQLADFKKVDNHVSKMYALITIRFDTFIRMCVTSFRCTFVKVGLLFHLQSKTVINKMHTEYNIDIDCSEHFNTNPHLTPGRYR